MNLAPIAVHAFQRTRRRLVLPPLIRCWTIVAGGCMLAAACMPRGTGAAPAQATTQAPAPAAAATAAAGDRSTLEGGGGGAAAVSTMSGVYTDDQAKRGKDVFAAQCSSCHTPTSHTGAPFQRRWAGKRLSDLYKYVLTEMPEDDPGSLPPSDVADVVAYLLKLNAMPAGPAELVPSADSLAKIRIEVKTK